jgi:hypothetical protein
VEYSHDFREEPNSGDIGMYVNYFIKRKRGASLLPLLKNFERT